LEIGRGRVVRHGDAAAILSFGAHLGEALAAADLLAQDGVQITVADARFAKPLDIGLIEDLIATHPCLITLEQGSTGGFGAQVLHYLAGAGALDRGCVIRTLTLPDSFIDQASPAQMYAEAGLTAQQIVETVKRATGHAPKSAGPAPRGDPRARLN
jgi:1-deoxy-D-xylulose-5-phosphate synthase